MPQTTAGDLGLEVLDALDEVRPWRFHVTVIEKQYLATTKFVDTVFDSKELLAVPHLWYNFHMFRHVLCCAVDDMLTPHKAYQGHTPNMVAFSTLLQAIHDFVDKHDSPPVVFYHDRQQEFGRSMQEMHEMFGKIRREDADSGFPKIARADYDFARFAMPTSK